MSLKTKEHLAQTHETYDIVIVGGGIVGLTLACALGSSSLRIAVIDQQASATKILTDDYDLRVSAITLASQKIFAALGVWQRIQARRASAFRKMHVWDATGNGYINFDSADIGESTLGYIIENSVIQAALYEQTQTYSNIDFICPAQLQQLKVHPESVALELVDGRQLITQLVIGADGAQSKVRKLAHIELTQRDYAHTAIVATIQTELPHQATAWQCFLPNGVLAFLPLAEAHTSSIVWSVTPQVAEHLNKLETKEFQQALTKAFAHRLGNVVNVSERVAFPLRMQHAKNYCLANIALLGDAAHTVHPLAGQGVNLGLLDAACLAEVILHAYNNKRAINSLATLRRYERWRKGDNLTMLALVAGFKHLFAGENKTIASARSLGLNLTNNLQLLKNFFMRQGMGIKGDLPSLARS